MSLLGACSSSETAPVGEAVLPPLALGRGTVHVLSGASDSPIAVGVVLRVTYDAAVIVAAARDDLVGPFRVQLPGDAPAPARLIARSEGVLVLSAARAGRDLRPFELTPEPPSGMAPVFLVPTRNLGLHAPLPCAVSGEPPSGVARPAGVVWLAGAPPWNDDDDRPAEARAADAEGGVVLDRQGRLVGLVGPPDRGLPRVLLASQVVARLDEPLLSVPGADLVRPDDTFLCYSVKVDSISELPRLGDDDASGPMLVLELRVGGGLIGRIEVTPGRPRADVLVGARAPGPLTVQLVALDRNLAQGETRAELTKPASAFAIVPRLDVALELDAKVLAAYPGARSKGTVRARIVFEPVDPDRAGGLRRAPLAPAPLAPGRPAETVLDLAAGRATEFFTVTDTAPEEVVALLYRRRVHATVALSVFAPGYESDLVSLLVKDRGPHVAVATGRLVRGRLMARVRQLSGMDDVPCEILIASRSDAGGIVGPLFRLVNREAAKEGTSFMDSDEFVAEVAEGLEKTGLRHEAICQAILDELGGRVQVARRLGFCLLERHFIPSRPLLEQAFTASNGLTPQAQDAGLILAELEPRDPRIRPVLRKACADPDPYMRARAIRSAARGGDPAFMEELAALCASDPAPIVERAVATARLNAALLRGEKR